MGVIPASISTLTNQYPRRDKQDPAKYQYVKNVMSTLPPKATPCCVQVSQALSLCGIPVPPTSYRRNPNPRQTINGRQCSYLLATDELEDFLNTLYGEPELINRDLTKIRSVQEIKDYIKDRPGLLIFRYGGLRAAPPPDKFEHTEFWDGTKMVQEDISYDLFTRPRVLMWDTNDPAKFLVDYMKTQP